MRPRTRQHHGAPEVRDLQRPEVDVEEQVVGLDVSVEYAAPVEVGHRVERLRVPLEDVIGRKRLLAPSSLLHLVRQRAPEESGHEHVRQFATVDNPSVDEVHHRRPPRGSQYLDLLPLESGRLLPSLGRLPHQLRRVHLFEREDLAIPDPLCAIHRARGAAAELLDEEVVAGEAVTQGALHEVPQTLLWQWHLDALADAEGPQGVPDFNLAGSTEVLA
mmetsp:Transcript_83936/g.242448  ORF Transcript_83936/g.242448 Transcript_83936/m.242448 type:complete len:218 (-) Transcript_83936:274-927(-)